MPRVVIAAGGTAGHVVPAVAVADELRARGAEVSFLGARGRLEADLIQHGYDKGLCALPYPPRFHGNCGAVKPGGFVILPTGDVHKCWDTV